MDLNEVATKAAEHQEQASRLLQKYPTEPNREKWEAADKEQYEKHLQEFRDANALFKQMKSRSEEEEELKTGRDYYFGNGKSDQQEHSASDEIAARDHMDAFLERIRGRRESARSIIEHSKAERFMIWNAPNKRVKPEYVDKHAIMSSIDSAGGYAAAPAEFIAQLQKDLVAASQIPAKCRMYNISSNMLSLPALASSTVDPKIWPSKFVGAWVNEEDRTVTAQAKQGGAGYFELINVPTGIYEPPQIPLTETMLEDQAMDLSGELSNVLAENTGPDLENAILTGDGLNKKPRGILTDLSGVSGFFVTSGTAGAVDYAGLCDLDAALAPQYHAGAVYVMNQKTMSKVNQLSVSAGHYLIQPFQGLLTMFGKPIVISNLMPDVGASNYPVLLANFDGYVLAQQRTFGVRFYDQTVPSMRIVYARWRIGGGIRRKQYFRLLKSNNS